MINQIKFTKMVASGNDFVVVETRNQKPETRSPRDLARRICDRKFGVGADGLLILEKSGNADLRMRIFNPDGSEPKMCGNGIRCAALWQSTKAGKALKQGNLKIQTRAGIIQAQVNKDRVKVKMSEPKDIRLDLPLKIGKPGKDMQVKPSIKVNFINTGVPHVIIFVEGLDKIDVVNIGRQIRFHKRFLPEGVNVDFVQIIDDNNIELRTYERGVEDETLACGTGAVAAALLYAIRYTLYANRRINVYTKGGEVLKVGFDRISDKFTPLEIPNRQEKKTKFLTGFKNIWLEGKVRIVYKGVYYV